MKTEITTLDYNGQLMNPEFLKDSRYSSFENLDSGIKTDITFV